MQRDARDCGAARRERLVAAACAVGLFAFLFVFFSRVHPLVMLDGDDWGYASYTRGALPVWGYWNPAKVLPEILMPVCVSAAGFLVMPLTGDFIGSITLVIACVVSLMITVYVCLMALCLRRRGGRTTGEAALLGAIFLAFHFVIFRTQRSDNVHLFYCWNVNTYFNYLIPGLLCAAIVLRWEAGGGRMQSRVCQGFAILAGYLAIFSNLFCSQTLAIYAGVRLLCALPDARKRPLSRILRERAWELAVLAVWLVAAIFELSGGRAQNLSQELSFFARLKLAAWALIGRIRTVNGVFFAVCAASVLLAVALLARSGLRQEEDRRFARQLGGFLACGALSGVYLLLLCAISAPDYMNRPDVLFGGIFFLLAAVVFSMGYVVRRLPRLALVLPLLLLVLTFEADTRVKTFREPNLNNYSARTCKAIDEAVMNQILAAADAGLTSAEFEVPEGPYWFVPDAMARAMLNCGLIDHEIVGYNVEIADFFERYGI